ncbi:MAG: type II CAAX prenyl endopeptidase Rce1 family protein [Chloroflexota bacterium]
MKNPLRVIGILVPYITVGIGLFAARNAWIALLGYHLGILILLALTGEWRITGRFRIQNPFHAPIGAALGLLAGAGVFVLWPFAEVSPNLHSTLHAWGLNLHTWPPFILYFALVNPWLEESYWRGWLGGDSRLPILRDFWFSSFHLLVVFPFVGWFWLAFIFLVLASVGWLLRQAARREGSLLAPSVFHLTADASILLVIFLLQEVL